jgi:hypothetical protein
MARKADAGLALKSFIMEFGVPVDLTIDGSKEQNSKGTEFMKSCRRNNIQVTRTRAPKSEPHRRSNSRSETALVPDYDQETGGREALGLRESVGPLK